MAYGLILAVCALGAVLVFARADARKAERINALKKELARQKQEREAYEKIADSVGRLSDDAVRGRLRNLSGK